MGPKCCVFFFLTRLLFSKFCCKISVVYLLRFLRRCVCMKEIKLRHSYIRGSLISCETIQTAVMLSDRQPGLNYGRFSTSPACNVFSDLQRLQHHLESILCLYKKRNSSCSIVWAFLSTKDAFRGIKPLPLVPTFEHDLTHRSYFIRCARFDPPQCFVFFRF